MQSLYNYLGMFASSSPQERSINLIMPNPSREWMSKSITIGLNSRLQDKLAFYHHSFLDAQQRVEREERQAREIRAGPIRDRLQIQHKSMTTLTPNQTSTRDDFIRFVEGVYNPLHQRDDQPFSFDTQSITPDPMPPALDFRDVHALGCRLYSYVTYRILNYKNEKSGRGDSESERFLPYRETVASWITELTQILQILLFEDQLPYSLLEKPEAAESVAMWNIHYPKFYMYRDLVFESHANGLMRENIDSLQTLFHEPILHFCREQGLVHRPV